MTEIYERITELDPITEVTSEDYVEISQKQPLGSVDPYLSMKFILGSFANLNYWSGTKAQYDLLVPDANTIYFIEEEIIS